MAHPQNLRTIPELRDLGLALVLKMECRQLTPEATHAALVEMRSLWLETVRVHNKPSAAPKVVTVLRPKWGKGKALLDLRKARPDMSCEDMKAELGMTEDGAAGRISAFLKRWELLGGEQPHRR